MNNTTIVILLCMGALIGVVFSALWIRLKNPTKHDDVFNLTPEQRAERDGDLIGSGTDFITTEQFEKQRGEYPVTPADASPPLSEYAKTIYPKPVLVNVEKEKSSITVDLSAQSTESYEAEIDRIQEERTKQLQKEVEEKRMAQVEKDKLRDAEIEEERVLKEEAARIKTELKKWMY